MTTIPARWLNRVARTLDLSSSVSEMLAISTVSSARFPEASSQSSFEQIPSLHERAHLAIRDAALQHPEPAIRMNVPQPLRPQRFHNILDARRDQLGGFHLVVFDIDQADPQADLRIQFIKKCQLVVPA